MRIIGLILGSILSVSQPLMAESSTKLDKVPEEFLLKGLRNVTVCTRASMFGRRKLISIIKKMQEDEPTQMAEDNEKIVKSAISDVNDIKAILETQINVGTIIVSALIETYHHTDDDLNDKMKPVVEATDEALKDLFADVKDYEKFTQAFVPKEVLCGNMIDEMSEQVKNYMNSIEIQN